MLNHVVGLDDLIYVYHGSALDSVHLVEYVLTLAFYLNAGVLSELCDLIVEGTEIDGHASGVHYHHHVEESLYNGLGDVKNVDMLVGEICADFGNDAYGVFADYCNDRSVHVKSVCLQSYIKKTATEISVTVFLVLPSVLR